MIKLSLIIIIAGLLTSGCEKKEFLKPVLAAEKPKKEEIPTKTAPESPHSLKEISLEERRRQAILQRSLSSDIYGPAKSQRLRDGLSLECPMILRCNLFAIVCPKNVSSHTSINKKAQYRHWKCSKLLIQIGQATRELHAACCWCGSAVERILMGLCSLQSLLAE